MHSCLSKKLKCTSKYSKLLTNFFEYLTKNDERSNIGEWANQREGHQPSSPKNTLQKKNAQTIVARLRGLFTQNTTQKFNMSLLVFKDLPETAMRYTIVTFSYESWFVE